jgi:hypothetical protein
LSTPIDNATVRYYIDGETTASIEFKPSLAAGVGFDDPAVWGTKLAGHGALSGAWNLNYRIPFQRSARVTVQLTAGAANTDPAGTCYLIVRGAENLPIRVGDLELPGSSARLTLHKIESRVFQPLAWVPLLDLPSQDGLIFQTTLAVESDNLNFLEACYHLYTPHDQAFPGTVLSTGTEDYFDSAYYFDGGEFRFPNSGNTHMEIRGKTRWSGYRFHEQDPLLFHGGVRLMWRIGDYHNHQDSKFATSPKCYIDAPAGSNDTVVGNPSASLVTSYVWAYTWAPGS